MTLWLANFLTLLVGSLLLSLLYEAIAGNKAFSLALSSICLVTLVGSVLAIRVSWKSTGILLGLDAVCNVVGALHDRGSKDVCPKRSHAS